MRTGPLAVVAVVALLVAGCSSPGPAVPPEWKGRNLREPGWTNTTLAPEWTLALEYPLGSGVKLTADYFVQGDTYLYFQALRMENGRAVRLQAHHANQEVFEMTTPQSGVYQLVWMNDAPFGQAFSWKAREGYSVRSYPPGEGPGCLTATAGDLCLLPGAATG